MLTVQGIEQFYGGSHTLWNVGVEVQEGACTAILGRNGVGKTTLLRAIMGIVGVAAGSVRFAGTELVGRPIEARARLGIGYVPQGREIFPQLTVRENLEIALVGAKRKKEGLPERIFELFPVLARMLKRRGGDLSGGQQQQLAIARALTLGPRLLILDEPSEGIQPSIAQEIVELIVRLNREEKLTVLLVEQKLHAARRAAREFVILDRGRAVATAPIEELSDELVARYLTV